MLLPIATIVLRAEWTAQTIVKDGFIAELKRESPPVNYVPRFVFVDTGSVRTAFGEAIENPNVRPARPVGDISDR